MYHYKVSLSGDGSVTKEKFRIKGSVNDYYNRFETGGKDFPLDNPFVTGDYTECNQITACENDEFIYNNLLAFLQRRVTERAVYLDSLANALAVVQMGSAKKVG